MDSQSLTASRQTSLPKILDRLSTHSGVACVLVLYRRQVVGIVTRQDILRAIAQNAQWASMRLSHVMTRPVVTVSQADLSADLAAVPGFLEQFAHHQISYLPVVDERQRLIGVLHQTTLLQAWSARSSEGRRSETAVLMTSADAATHEDELRRQHQRAQLLAEITLKIRQSLQLKEILQTTVDEVQRLLDADRVLIYQVLPDGTGQPISEAVVPPYPPVLGFSFPEEVFPEDYQALYAEGRVQAIADIHAPDCGLADCLVEFSEQWGIQSKLIVPIIHPLQPEPNHSQTPRPHQLWGLLIAHQCSSPRQWSEFELDLLLQLADQISIALSHGQMLEYLEERVRLRTAELTQANDALHQEIRERTQIEAALRQSEEQLRLVTNNLPVLIAYVDSQQHYRFNNQAYQHWFGQAPTDIYGQSIKTVMGAAHYRAVEPYIDTALTGQPVTYESELMLKDGRSHSVSVAYVPHLEEIGEAAPQVKGFFALTTDISDRKAIERMKDEFIAVVSHELRTPLTSIHGSLKLMATGRLGHLSAEGQQMLEVADENTDRLVRLVNNVLDLQRIESGEVTMDAQVCDAADLIEQATEAMGAIAQEHDIEIQTQSDPIAIWADPDYIVQTLTNLLSNAIKFSAPGNPIRLAVRSTVESVSPPQSSERFVPRDRPPAALALFSVEDRGQGIPADKLNSIFERFQQVDSSDSRKKGGTGLGLAICRKIVEQHGGQIWAESQLGIGSCFYFTVPLQAAPRPVTAKPQTASAGLTMPPRSQKPPRSKKSHR
ncbi:MAG: ATP-binding protein [Leptolyngbyaceae cyanobacterium]